MQNNENPEQPKKLLELGVDEEELRRKAEHRKKVVKEILSWAKMIVGTILVVLLIRTFVFEPIMVDGGSMNDTFATHDRVFVTKFDYFFRTPDRGEVVICHYPNRRENFIKRVVALPGDTVEIKGGVTYVNGEALNEDFITRPTNKDFAQLTLGEDEYFVMGDNRANSNDSRYVGPLKKSQIVGLVRYRFFPFDNMNAVVKEYQD